MACFAIAMIRIAAWSIRVTLLSSDWLMCVPHCYYCVFSISCPCSCACCSVCCYAALFCYVILRLYYVVVLLGALLLFVFVLFVLRDVSMCLILDDILCLGEIGTQWVL